MSKQTIFLSLVSGEFRSYRELLAGDLERCRVLVETQEKWGTLGDTTLDKLDVLIGELKGNNGAVIHVVGDSLGFVPPAAAVDLLLEKHSKLLPKLTEYTGITRQQLAECSYTQWEAYLAVFHKVRLHIYRADKDADRETNFTPDPAEQQLQEAHFQRIRDLGRDRDVFLSQERLSSFVLADLHDILPAAPATTIPMSTGNLKHTAAELFGRQTELDRLDKAWADDQINVMVIEAFGGSGKTSLVADWMDQLAAKGWRDVQSVFDWSFYSQGTRDIGDGDMAVSADGFIDAALTFLGDENPTEGSAADRGTRLAQLIAQQKGLLVLDGVEPLQHPPGPVQGRLTDPGLEALLRNLAAQNTGLCIVTTREHMPELDGRRTVDDWPLHQLSEIAGAALLHSLGVTKAGDAEIPRDDHELQAAVCEVEGHALTLGLMGRFLVLELDGDIRQRDTFQLEDADPEWDYDPSTPYGHAFKVMRAYARWFEDEKADRNEREQLACRQQLAILRLLGLFNRPASAACLDALCSDPISGLTDELTSLSTRDWKRCITRLSDIGLVTRLQDASGKIVDCGLDSHPILRTYFANELRTNSQEAFESAHGRLFDHLCETTEHQPDTLPGLQPLYQAVTHGCLAGRHQEACDKVYFERIKRGQEAFSSKKLGALGSDLGAIASFFDSPWRRLSPNLSEPAQAWLLSEAAFRLRALGRLNEAREPMEVSVEMAIAAADWKQAAIRASNLSELELTLGLLSSSVSSGRRAIEFAGRSEDAFQRMSKRTTAADALHQHGELSEAHDLFEEAERIQAERQPQFELLYSLAGFHCCDLLLAPAERAAWSSLFEPQGDSPGSDTQPAANQTGAIALRLMSLTDACKEATRRATQTLEWANTYNLGLLAVALDHLTLARASLYRVILESSGQATADMLLGIAPQLDQALTGLRKAGQAHLLCNGLLTGSLFAWLVERSSVVSTENGKHEPALKSTTSQTGDTPRARHGSDRRVTDDWPTSLNYPPQHFLDEAQLIAERGPMPLYLAEIQLNKARLFEDKDALAKARTLIEKYEYKRRLPELEDAEAVL